MDVIVVGAGAAGLAAARALAEGGLRVVVVEARDRVGGRIFSQPVDGGAIVEHGAEFVHGRAPELWALLEESGLQVVERSGAMLTEQQPGGGLTADEDDEGDDITSPLSDLADLPGDDLPFAEWLAASNVPEGQREALTGYVEGFNAADAGRISARSLGVQQQAEEAIEGDRAWHLPGGYALLPEHMAARAQAAGAEIRLGCEVLAVRWWPGQVVVSTKQGDLRAPRCVITLPLGVLQAANASAPGSVRIEPEPRALFEARRMAMGQVARFTMVFRERWWERAPKVPAEFVQTLHFVFTRQRMPPVWWTRHPERETLPTLVGWSGGPRSEALRRKSPEALETAMCGELAEVFGVAAEEVRAALLGVHTYDWSADRFALGSYSYVPAGALDAPEAMGVPVAGTLFFAGEHTDTTGHWGTVHAALRSGLRVAGQVRAAARA